MSATCAANEQTTTIDDFSEMLYDAFLQCLLQSPQIIIDPKSAPFLPTSRLVHEQAMREALGRYEKSLALLLAAEELTRIPQVTTARAHCAHQIEVMRCWMAANGYESGDDASVLANVIRNSDMTPKVPLKDLAASESVRALPVDVAQRYMDFVGRTDDGRPETNALDQALDYVKNLKIVPSIGVSVNHDPKCCIPYLAFGDLGTIYIVNALMSEHNGKLVTEVQSVYESAMRHIRTLPCSSNDSGHLAKRVLQNLIKRTYDPLIEANAPLPR